MGIAFKIVIIAIIATSIYFIIQFKYLFAKRKQIKEIFDYQDEILALQHKLVDTLSLCIKNNEIETAYKITDIVNKNWIAYDAINPILMEIIENKNSNLNWQAQIILPKFYTIENNKEIEYKNERN